ncbi:MAG: hypothetical protein IPK58_14375 [Acidobacteria bacterium]|nr:hypothetical protein [Acidobacteriota bacterium]
MNDRGKIGTAGIIFLLAAYVVLRFWRLEDSCLWFDEIFSVHAASMPWSGILGFVAQDLIHPPLFYVLLKLLDVGRRGIAPLGPAVSSSVLDRLAGPVLFSRPRSKAPFVANAARAPVSGG